MAYNRQDDSERARSATVVGEETRVTRRARAMDWRSHLGLLVPEVIHGRTERLRKGAGRWSPELQATMTFPS